MKRREFLKAAAALSAASVGAQQVAARTGTRSAQQQNDMPNILLLVFDTFSARNMGLHGYARPTTPNMARFAEQATVYHRHYAGGSYTTPGTASLLTGAYSWQHRAFHLRTKVLPQYGDQNIFAALKPTHKTISYTHNALVSILFDQMQAYIDNKVPTSALALDESNFGDEVADAMYGTRLFSRDFFAAHYADRVILPKRNDGKGSSLFLSLAIRRQLRQRYFNFNRTYRQEFPRGVPRSPETDWYFLVEDAVDWMAATAAEETTPYFQYVHLFPPHSPYNSRADFDKIFDGDGFVPMPKPQFAYAPADKRLFTQDQLDKKRQRYDEFIMYVDAEFGRLVDLLEEQGTLDNTILIMTSDHGELFERGIEGHITRSLYDPVVNIPLIVRLPGQTTRQDIFQPTTCIDILPTLTHLTGNPTPDWTVGTVLPGISAETDRNRDVFTMDGKENSKSRPHEVGTVALMRDNFRLIRYFGYDNVADAYELYNVADDPEEVNNLYSESDNLSQTLKQALLAALESVNAPYAAA